VRHRAADSGQGDDPLTGGGGLRPPEPGGGTRLPDTGLSQPDTGLGQSDKGGPRPPETGEVDFGPEHQKVTFAGEVPDGPEHSRDPDSPTGLAGADPDNLDGEQ
jgi:hypothetical protein